MVFCGVLVILSIELEYWRVILMKERQKKKQEFILQSI